MINAERQVRILEIVNQRSVVSVRELSEILDVSEMTVRRDLNAMGNRGIIERTHGGVRSLHNVSNIPYQSRLQSNVAEKKAIARYAADQVVEGDTLFLGSGSSVAMMVEYLRSRNGITIVTPSIQVVQTLLPEMRGTLIVLGGVVKPSLYAIVGDSVDATLERYHFNKAFIGVSGIIPMVGLFNADYHVSNVERIVISRTSELYVLADNTKFGKSALLEIGPVSAARTIISDTGLAPIFVDDVIANGGNIVLVNPLET